MNTNELAKKFLDGILYSGNWINRWHPFDEETHYGDWVEKFEKELDKIVPELGEDLFTDDFVQLFCDGDYDEMQDNCKNHPCLKTLDQMLNDYFDWLCENA